MAVVGEKSVSLVGAACRRIGLPQTRKGRAREDEGGFPGGVWLNLVTIAKRQETLNLASCGSKLGPYFSHVCVRSFWK